jgi:hypothetical protein
MPLKGLDEREQLVKEISLADASKRASAAVVLLGWEKWGR